MKRFQALSVALVAVRGLVGGPIGIFIDRATGSPAAVLGLAAALCLGGALILFRLDRRT